MTIAAIIILGIICLAGTVCSVWQLGELDDICDYGYITEEDTKK